VPTITLRVEDFERVLRERVASDLRIAERAAADAAMRGVARAVQRTNELGLVDMGAYKSGWKAEGATLRNDAPYAGVIEYGRRPGRPGPPLAPIREWVLRKLVPEGAVAPEDAEGAARAIRDAIHVRGTPPKYVLRDLIPHLRADFVAAILARLRKG
jgi:hypothetical protein